ncbi:T9SS type A sorting domain-containing protein [Mangrovimonas sp. YM274]|uniref:T9SS type A sorting domain-containing protein n=1 Tax=Mangrovimonas sp. YM274 TaxID=3070660 RepID=UPI0027DBD0F1|nr:T9SS type A sorting domain-containing protein [Mangrovimonas sp. YM274]WMI69719.1 T9SS type A sorting domain-containing protein [Mangrovimonas sp. YM274]
MKQVYLFFVCCLFWATANAQFVYVPDQNLRNILINTNCVDSNGDGTYNTDVDTNNNGFIEVSEALAVTKLKLESLGTNEVEIDEMSIVDPTGLAALTNLTYFDVNDQPNLNTLPLNYESLEYLILGNVGIESLDTSSLGDLIMLGINNTDIVNLYFNSEITIQYVMIYFNELLETIDLGEDFTAEGFFCHSNPILSELDMGGYNKPDSYEYNQIQIASNENLAYLNFKNGTNNQFLWEIPPFADPDTHMEVFDLPNLELVCVDNLNSGVAIGITESLDNFVNFTEYCNFIPGGSKFTVSGQNYIDYNGDGCDEADTPYYNLPMHISNGTVEDVSYNYGNSLGANYSIPLPEGSYVITPQLENDAYFTVEPESLTVDFITDPIDVVQDFCITPIGDFNDLEVSLIPLNQARPGFEADYKVICKNKGTTALSGDVTLSFDANVMSVVETTPVSFNENEGELLWGFMDLVPFQTEQFYITMLLNTPTDTDFPLLGGEVLEFTAVLEFEGTDETPEDNTANLFQTVVNSFDPNDKTCLEGASITESQVGDYVTYVVRFENTGTASAINVVVKDYIDTDKYDVSSLMPLDASHEFYTRITEGNKLEFIFEDINLPFEDATNDGFVAFKLKTLSTLQPGDEFSNEAEIYFDYNAAIHTNNATTVVEDALSIEEISKEGIVSVYPNPVSNVLNFRTSESLLSLAIYDLQGRLVKQKDITQGVGNFKCDVSNLSKGMYTVQAKTAKGEQFLKVIKN